MFKNAPYSISSPLMELAIVWGQPCFLKYKHFQEEPDMTQLSCKTPVRPVPQHQSDKGGLPNTEGLELVQQSTPLWGPSGTLA